MDIVPKTGRMLQGIGQIGIKSGTLSRTLSRKVSRDG